MTTSDWIALFTFAFMVISGVTTAAVWVMTKHGGMRKELEEIKSANFQKEQARLKEEIESHTRSLDKVNVLLIETAQEIGRTRREIAETRDDFAEKFLDLAELIAKGRTTEVSLLQGQGHAQHVHNKKK